MKNTTATSKGATLAKIACELPKTTPAIKLADLKQGNRAARRAAAKQERRK
jgi:hypothetical protein